MADIKEGIIIKGIGGFYYVKVSDKIYECKARGIFRKDGISPLVGDKVGISVQNDIYGSIDKIFPRKNSLVRPPIANIDRLFILSSVCDPSPNTLIIDRIIAVAEDKGIEPVIVFTKTDMADASELISLYRNAGFKAFGTSMLDDFGVDEIKELLSGHISAFTGNSGVGKSSLLNVLYENFELPTGEISKKLGRGRHTTRHVELLMLPGGGYVADTPGFSSIDIEKMCFIRKENLQFCFREFELIRDECKFSTSCSHTKEKGCAVIKAVEEGKISVSRFESYKTMYDEVKNIEDWQIRTNQF